MKMKKKFSFFKMILKNTKFKTGYSSKLVMNWVMIVEDKYEIITNKNSQL